jgi:hypothetical protein
VEVGREGRETGKGVGRGWEREGGKDVSTQIVKYNLKKLSYTQNGERTFAHPDICPARLGHLPLSEIKPSKSYHCYSIM